MQGEPSNLGPLDQDRLKRFEHIGKCDFQDVFKDDIGYITNCAFGDFGVAGESGANAQALYVMIHEEMAQLACSRCNLKGHSKAACWYGNQMNLTARKLGGLFKTKYAVIRQRVGALRKRAQKHAALTEKKKANLLASKKDVSLGVVVDQVAHLGRPIDFTKSVRAPAIFRDTDVNFEE